LNGNEGSGTRVNGPRGRNVRSGRRLRETRNYGHQGKKEDVESIMYQPCRIGRDFEIVVPGLSGKTEKNAGFTEEQQSTAGSPHPGPPGLTKV
jgi:hypothetical protein